MNKVTRGTKTFVKIGLREAYCTCESCIFTGKVGANLDRGALV